MRLSKIENSALKYAIKDLNLPVYIFWSRTDDNKKWWDIDIIIINNTSEKNLSISIRVEREFFKKCEEKIDVVVFPKIMNEEQKLFFNSINKVCLKNW